jgi:FKBP-type peptidyl-prolyl cis-trans isomerase 2
MIVRGNVYKDFLREDLMSEKVKKKDFVELKYSGYANGDIFDSNIEEDIKKLNSEIKAKKTVVCVGEEMVVKGLDNTLEGKEIGKEYEIEFGFKEGFGERKRELLKTIPLKIFTEKKIDPRAGMVLTLDNYMVRIITVSGARVVTDFNNPLAGKNLKYKFKIIRIVEDDKEKVEALFEIFWKFVPEFSLEESKIVVKGPKGLEVFVNEFGGKFKELMGKELVFEEKKEGLEEKIIEKKNVKSEDEIERGESNKE